MASCGIGMAIGIATAATVRPSSPMPKARSKASERRRTTKPWLMRIK
jgi:hypothetical protein